MALLLQQSIARVRSSKDGPVVGTAFLISRRWVMTCAHVVNDALGRDWDAADCPNDPVWIDFPFAPIQGAAATVAEWRPPANAPSTDIAVLTLDRDVDLRPYLLVGAPPRSGDHFWTKGFPQGHDRGMDASGEFQTEIEFGRLLVRGDHQFGYFIQGGFSGAPLLDENSDVFGMAAEADRNTDRRTAFIIPADQLERAWPPLARPYKGLDAFQESDARFFFGRERAIDELRDKLRRLPFVALVGRSGSGKSSLVRAGLIPRLRAEDPWNILTFRPGAPYTDPFRNLSVALLSVGSGIDRIHRETDINALSGRLRDQPNALADRLRTLGVRHTLILADQFEELFTLVPDPAEHDPEQSLRARFVRTLLAAADTTRTNDPTARILLTIRADYMGRALAVHGLADALKDADVKLGPLSPTNIRRAIEEPARCLGVSFAPGLVDELLVAVAASPDALPLLEFTLGQLWPRQQNRLIASVAADQPVPILATELIRHADHTFVALSRRFGESIFRKAITALVWLGDPRSDGEDTRRVRRQKEFDLAEWELIEQLAAQDRQARLVAIGTSAASGEPAAEIVHEALIRSWPCLRAWLDEDRAFRLWLQRAELDADMWRKTQDSTDLLVGRKLAEADRWREERAAAELASIRDLLDASAAQRSADEQRERDRAAAELRRQQELANASARLADEQAKLAEAANKLASEQTKRADAQTALAAAEKGRALSARRWGFISAAIAALTLLLAVGLFGSAQEASRLTQQATRGTIVSAHETARAQAALARIENDNRRYYEAAAASLRGLTDPPTIDTDPLQLVLWAELLRSAADAFLVPPLPHQGSIWAASFDRTGERVVTASDDKTARIWDTRTGKPIGDPLQHQGAIFAASFDCTGERVVTASSDNTARIWDARTGKLIGDPLQQQGSVWAASFDCTGERVVTASDDKTARIWDARTGKPIGDPLQHQGSVRAASFDPTGDRVVTASFDNTARIWDARTGKPIGDPLQHQDSVSAASFDRTGERIVTASDDNTARIWDARTGKPIGDPLQHQGSVRAASFDRTGERIVTASSDNTARIWDARTGKPIGDPLQHQGSVWAASFDRTGERIVTASSDKTARIWDARTGKPIGDPLQHQGSVWAALFDPTGDRVVTASFDKTARIWDARTGKPIGDPLQHRGSVRAASFDRTGDRVVTASFDNTARIWDARTGKSIGDPLKHRGLVRAASFDRTGERIVTASSDNTARIWDARTGKPIGDPLQHQGSVWAALFDPTGERIVTASSDKTARIWDARTGKPIGDPLQHHGSVRAASFDRTGERIVTASSDKTARIWDARTGKPIGNPLQHQGSVSAASFDRTGERVVTASDDNTARIWDARTGKPIGDPLKHQGMVWAASFDRTGERVVTASDDNTARIWAARTGKPIGDPLQHQGSVWAALFDPTGERIVTASSDKTARIWDARTGKPIGDPLQHQGSVLAASFDRTGERVVTASDDNTARIWAAPPDANTILARTRSLLAQTEAGAPLPLVIPALANDRPLFDTILDGFRQIFSKD